MKMLYALPGLVLLFAACDYPVIHSLPEPELEVIPIVFSEARYNPAHNTITLSFDKEYEKYDGMYETYNKEKILYIENYLRNGDFSVSRTRYYRTGLEINLVWGTKVPEKLIFNTEKPCYFYTHYSYYASYGERSYAVITAKAFIKNPELTVLDRPTGP
jgi:hypothetical protein